MVGRGDGESFTAIAARLGKAVSTAREVAGNGGRGDYRAWRAHQRARARARRPKTPKLVACARLAGKVTEWLRVWWSPQEISRRLPIEFPGDPLMRVSHETIYQALFVRGRGELRRELARCLRTGRVKRSTREEALGR